MDRVQVTGTTRLIALLGDPVPHSLSPLIHNHALSLLKLPFVYIPLTIRAADLSAAVFGLRSCSFAGANVTIPHKQAVVPLCDRISDLSRITGTVNTLYWDQGLLCGTTTDPKGFYRALAWMGHDPKNGSIVILGNGGTARTLAYSLALDRLSSSLTVVGRSEEKARLLADEISVNTGFAVEATSLSSPSIANTLSDCTLLVNCTSVGMHPHSGQSPLDQMHLHSAMTVFDVIYNPLQSKLLLDAARKGCTTQNGLRMLLYQGLASFELWTGVAAPESIFDIRELQSALT